MANGTGGPTIVRHARRLAKLVKKHSAAGVLLRGGTAPAVAALVLMADIFQALDAAGAFEGVILGDDVVMFQAKQEDISWAMSMSAADALEILFAQENARKQLYGAMFHVKHSQPAEEI